MAIALVPMLPPHPMPPADHLRAGVLSRLWRTDAGPSVASALPRGTDRLISRLDHSVGGNQTEDRRQKDSGTCGTRVFLEKKEASHAPREVSGCRSGNPADLPARAGLSRGFASPDLSGFAPTEAAQL